jgi:hypothetical protein
MYHRAVEHDQQPERLGFGFDKIVFHDSGNALLSFNFYSVVFNNRIGQDFARDFFH